MKIAIIGAGWAGLTAAVEATLAGHKPVIFEATRALGGRARAVSGTLPDGTPLQLDNGQHILIGAYRETLRLLRRVGVELERALLSQPMTLQFPDGQGLRFAPWPPPLDALAAIVTARGWQMADKWALLRLTNRWRRQAFQCDATHSVAQLCAGLRPRVMAELIEPLCVSALNTPVQHASAQVFLRVLQDALFGAPGSSRLLLPRVDLGALFPDTAASWLQQRGASLRLGSRVDRVQAQGRRWQINDEVFDGVVVATCASTAVQLLHSSAQTATSGTADALRRWSAVTAALRFEAIATVYAWAADASLPRPMLCLHARPPAPAQFVFDRGQLGGPRGLLAFVVSASTGSRQTLQAQVLEQARDQLGLSLRAVQTVVEKRATFACRPNLQRPPLQIAPGLVACGDYVAGPYPATLEGAVCSARAALGPDGLGLFEATRAPATALG